MRRFYFLLISLLTITSCQTDINSKAIRFSNKIQQLNAAEKYSRIVEEISQTSMKELIFLKEFSDTKRDSIEDLYGEDLHILFQFVGIRNSISYERSIELTLDEFIIILLEDDFFMNSFLDDASVFSEPSIAGNWCFYLLDEDPNRFITLEYDRNIVNWKWYITQKIFNESIKYSSQKVEGYDSTQCAIISGLLYYGININDLF